MPRLGATEKLPPAQRGRRRIDLAIGIALGVVLGIAVISAFLFLGSEGSIDAPRISADTTNFAASRLVFMPVVTTATSTTLLD